MRTIEYLNYGNWEEILSSEIVRGMTIKIIEPDGWIVGVFIALSNSYYCEGCWRVNVKRISIREIENISL